MSQKVICDPIHHYIYIDLATEALILKLINSREIQRLRRIRQLGASFFTYPSAEHSRFGHALGTFHLAKTALEYLEKNSESKISKHDRLAVMAAALLHDVGHGPFSHVLEKKNGNSHEFWTEKLITSGKTEINYILKKYGSTLHEKVINILFHPHKKYRVYNALLSSQIDMDRMDYLLRDSYFCGNNYGTFDYRWLFHTMRIGSIPSGRMTLEQPMWIEKAIWAIEDYIFARYNMYWTVYYHCATRGYEELLKTILKRAKDLSEENIPVEFVSDALEMFITKDRISDDEYLSLDDSVLIMQLNIWSHARDRVLRDLCQRFLSRKGLKWVDYREEKDEKIDIRAREDAQIRIAREMKKLHFDPKYYFLGSVSAAKAYDYYRVEKGADEQSAKTSIFILDKKNNPTEISARKEMQRLKAITGVSAIKKFYYVPEECRATVDRILEKM